MTDSYVEGCCGIHVGRGEGLEAVYDPEEEKIPEEDNCRLI